jgi:hypothetical protein
MYHPCLFTLGEVRTGDQDILSLLDARFGEDGSVSSQAAERQASSLCPATFQMTRKRNGLVVFDYDVIRKRSPALSGLRAAHDSIGFVRLIGTVGRGDPADRGSDEDALVKERVRLWFHDGPYAIGT